MIDLDRLSELIEKTLTMRYLYGHPEVIFIGIAKRENLLFGDYVIRIGVIEKTERLIVSLRNDSDINRLVDVEIVVKPIRAHESLKSRISFDTFQQVLRPGIEVMGARSGAISAIVSRERCPYVLSNAHVLGEVGDAVFQPTSHVTNPQCNKIGEVIISDESLDCAISSITNRDYDNEVVDLRVRPSIAIRASIGDAVIKFGLATRRTYGVITTIRAVVKKHPKHVTNQFIIEPDMNRLPPNLEISKVRDSGAPWIKTDAAGNPTSLMVGIESGGDPNDTDRSLPGEYAHATEVFSILSKYQMQLFNL